MAWIARVTVNVTGSDLSVQRAWSLVRSALISDWWQTPVYRSGQLIANGAACQLVFDIEIDTHTIGEVEPLMRDGITRYSGLGVGGLQVTYLSGSGSGGLGISGGIGGTVVNSNIFGGQNLLQGNAGNGATYTVVTGDTFNRIAAKFHLTPDQLAALNPSITNRNVISVGQVLRVGGNAAGISGGLATPVGLPASTPPAVVNNPSSNNLGAPKDTRNWFDKTFFTGAGALTGVAIGTLVVLGVVVVVPMLKQD